MSESTNATVRRAYADLRALHVCDQLAALRALSAFRHRAELSVAEVAELLVMFPAGRPEEFPAEAECAGLLEQVGHEDIPACRCPVCLVAFEETDALTALARAGGVAEPTVPELRVSPDPTAEPQQPPAARLTITEVGLSRAELVATLYELSFLEAAELAELGPDEVRRTVAEALLAHGRDAVSQAVDRLNSPPPSVWDSAFLELCERQVEVAFGLPRRPHYDYLLPQLAPFEAWALFAAEHGPAPAAPVSPAPAGVPADADEFWPARELVVA